MSLAGNAILITHVHICLYVFKFPFRMFSLHRWILEPRLLAEHPDMWLDYVTWWEQRERKTVGEDAWLMVTHNFPLLLQTTWSHLPNFAWLEPAGKRSNMWRWKVAAEVADASYTWNEIKILDMIWSYWNEFIENLSSF